MLPYRAKETRLRGKKDLFHLINGLATRKKLQTQCIRFIIYLFCGRIHECYWYKYLSNVGNLVSHKGIIYYGKKILLL